MVGKIDAVDPGAVHALLDDGRVPVISSVARSESGEVYNVNADTAAAAVAVALDAVKLVVLTDVEGLYADWPGGADEAGGPGGAGTSGAGRADGAGRPGSAGRPGGAEGAVISELSAARLEAMLPGLSEGMIPKMEACLMAVRGGVPQAHVLDGRLPHAILLEIFTDSGIGTMVLPDRPRDKQSDGMGDTR
jgi:acetylglutamate kinase